MFVCWDVMMFMVSILVLCSFMLCGGYFLGERSDSYNSNMPFESGIVSLGSASMSFPVKFYLIAMIFVIFDVEGMYMYMWSISVSDVGWMGFIEIFMFIFVLFMSLIYLMKIGMFNWMKN